LLYFLPLFFSLFFFCLMGKSAVLVEQHPVVIADGSTPQHQCRHGESDHH
jgi:hypothetical protein